LLFEITDNGTTILAVGERFLVSVDDIFACTCGFTQP
jgi:hypothetical protein